MKSICKKALAALLSAILICSASPLLANAETVGGVFGADGDTLTWSLDTDSGVLTIGGTGDMGNYDKDDSPWKDHVDRIRSVIIEDEVTSIGNSAFEECSNLTEVTIGSGVTWIGEGAFAMAALSSVFIPRSVQEIGTFAFACISESEDAFLPTLQQITVDPENAFFFSQDGVLYDAQKTSLILFPCGYSNHTFSIPDNVTTVRAGAFCFSTNLENVTIPDSVTTIGEMAFYFCASLDSVIIPDSVTDIGSESFSDCMSLVRAEIGNNVESIGEDAFSGCTSLTDVTIGNRVTHIGSYAFSECERLNHVTIPDSVTEIGYRAFSDCSSLSDVTIGNQVASIGDFAFNMCTDLESVTIPDSVTEIGRNTFYECSSLAHVTIGNHVETIGETAFFGCSSLGSVTLPNSVTEIGWAAFGQCAELAVISIPSRVTEIEPFIFTDCKKLTNVTIPSSVTRIGTSAFQNCSALENIHIPSGVMEIGVNAFAGCSNLAYLCSDKATSYAKTFAESQGIEFRLCNGHVGGDSDTVFGTCGAKDDDVLWALNLDTGVLTISGTGAMADYSYAVDAPWIDYRSSIQSVVIDSGVTTIGNRAFYLCRSLTDVTITGSVSTIGENAFEECSSLERLTIPDGVTTIGAHAFEACALSSVFIPRSVTKIGSDAFLCATTNAENEPPITLHLQSINVDPENMVYSSQDGVLYNKNQSTLILYPFAAENATFTIPNSVTTVSAGAFRFCRNLQSVTIPDSVNSIGEAAFLNCTALQSVSIPGSVETIGSSTFANCTNLVSVAIPDSVTTIGANAFYCTSLTAFTFPNDLTVIGEHAFSNTNLAVVTLPDGVAEIGAYAFSNCAKLAFVHIPSSAAAIGSNVFVNCANLEYLCSDTAIALARTYAAENNIAFRLCAGHESAADTICGECGAEGDNVLWTLNLGNGKMVVSGTDAMDDFTSADDTPWANYRASIRTVSIQNNVTTIGENAFADCTRLTSVTIGEGVTSVGTGAFSDCALTRVSIPAGVTEIGKDAFACDATLLEIGVDPANAVYASNDGVLYNNAQTELILYPDASLCAAFEIPDTVEEIAAEAFKGAVNLVSVHVPAAVTAIGSDAFADCSNLEFFCCNETCSYIRSYALVNGIGFRLCNGHDGQLRIAGDANGDGVVNLKDAVVMRRYLAGGWDVTILAANADVDGSNSVTLADVTLICRFLAGGWDVVLV